MPPSSDDEVSAEDVPVVADAAGDDSVVVVVDVDDWSLPLEHPAAINAASRTGGEERERLGLHGSPSHESLGRYPWKAGRSLSTGEPSPGSRTRASVSRVFIRYASPRDADRLVADGVVGGPTPTGEPWAQRVAKWLAEQQAGRRLMLVAEDVTGLLGTVQLVFRFRPATPIPRPPTASTSR